jgi:hypothetical protein
MRIRFDNTLLLLGSIKCTNWHFLCQISLDPVASLQARLEYYEKRVWLQIPLTILGLLIFFSLGKEIGWVVTVLLGVVTNLITTLGINIVTRTKRRISRSS